MLLGGPICVLDIADFPTRKRQGNIHSQSNQPAPTTFGYLVQRFSIRAPWEYFSYIKNTFWNNVNFLETNNMHKYIFWRGNFRDSFRQWGRWISPWWNNDIRANAAWISSWLGKHGTGYNLIYCIFISKLKLYHHNVSFSLVHFTSRKSDKSGWLLATRGSTLPKFNISSRVYWRLNNIFAISFFFSLARDIWDPDSRPDSMIFWQEALTQNWALTFVYKRDEKQSSLMKFGFRWCKTFELLEGCRD